MATQQVGGIDLHVNIETKGALDSVSDMDKVINMADSSLTKLDKKTMLVSKSNRALTKSAKEAEKALAAKSRRIGQTSIQLQQMIGQVQGGTPFLTAFSQQIADIGIVGGFGFAGAMAGIGASIAGILLPNLFKSTDALEDIEAAIKNVSAAMTLSADGVADYSKKMEQLKNISEALLKVKLANLIAEQQEAMKMATDGIAESLDELRGSFTTYNGLVEKVFGDTSKNAHDAMRTLNSALTSLELGATEEKILAVEAALEKATAAGINNTDAGRVLATQLIEMVAQYKIGEITIEQFNKALADTEVITKKTSKSLDSFDRFAKNLSTRVFKLRSESLERQKALKLEEAAQAGVSKEIMNSIAVSFDKMIANEREKESLKALTEQTRKRKEAQAESIAADVAAAAVMDKLHKDHLKRQEEKEKADKVKRKEAGNFATGISDRGMSEAEQRATEQILLEQYYEEGLISEQQYQDALTQIMAEGVAAREQMLQMSLGSFSSSFDEIAGVLKKSEGEQSNAYKAMFALSKGFAIAQAGLNLSLAVSNAMASGPFPWNLGAMAAVGAAGASLISSIGSAVYGGRENGGDMLGGKTYEVGEKNKPELLMIPGNGGKMFSNREAKAMMNGGGGGGEANVTINNYAAADGYQARTSKDSMTQDIVVDIINAQSANPNSRMRRNLSQGTDIKNTPGGGRM